jgi:Tudor domain
VTLVDYADNETIPLADVFDILPRFCRVPCQGLKLRLFGLSQVNKWPEAIPAAVDSNVK